MNVYHWTEDGHKIDGSGKRIPGGDVDAYAKAAARGLFAECDTVKTTFDGKHVDESQIPLDELRRRYGGNEQCVKFAQSGGAKVFWERKQSTGAQNG